MAGWYNGLRLPRYAALLGALCALGFGIGYWMMDLRSDLREAAKAIASVTHSPATTLPPSAPVVDRMQPAAEELSSTDTDSLSERELLRCLVAGEEQPLRSQARLLCYRIELDRLQEWLREEYTLLLALSPIDQQGPLASSQQQWESSLASRCSASKVARDLERPFLSGYRCRIDALRSRIKVLREIT
jgi:hypothetical protein